MSFSEFYQRSINEPEQFWAEQARRIDWQTPFTQTLDHSNPPFARWFCEGRTNLCHNAIDRWLEKQPAPFCCGIGSPVSIASSSHASPWVISPSTGTRSPVVRRSNIPGCTSARGTLFSPSSVTRRAVVIKHLSWYISATVVLADWTGSSTRFFPRVAHPMDIILVFACWTEPRVKWCLQMQGSSWLCVLSDCWMN